MGAVSLGLGPDGKRIRRKVSGKTKQEDRAKLQALHEELNAGVKSSSTYTMRDAADDWLPERPGRRRCAGCLRVGCLVETDAASGKVKRIRRNPQVRVAACAASGRLRGEQVPAVAEILPDSEIGGVERLIADKYRFDMIIFRPLRFVQARLHLGRPRTGSAILAITPG